MAHTENIARHLANAEMKKKIVDEQSKPVPRLGFAHISAQDLETHLNAIVDFASIPPLSKNKLKQERPQWHEITIHNDLVIDSPDGRSHRPVECMVYSLSQHLTFEDSEKLWNLGCNIVTHPHVYKLNGKNHTQQCAAIPLMLLEGTNDAPEYERDIKGRALFCAWLLNRGHVSTGEIEKTFGVGYLKEAQDPLVKKAIEGAFGAPVPSLQIGY
jgi:hypothetical protein